MDIPLVRVDDPVTTICLKTFITYCYCAGSSYLRYRCIWHCYFSLISHAMKQVLHILPLSSTINFKIRKMDCTFILMNRQYQWVYFRTFSLRMRQVVEVMIRTKKSRPFLYILPRKLAPMPILSCSNLAGLYTIPYSNQAKCGLTDVGQNMHNSHLTHPFQIPYSLTILSVDAVQYELLKCN